MAGLIIPKSFKLHGRTIKVVSGPRHDDLMAKSGWSGFADYEDCLIAIRSDIGNRDTRELVYYHELAHHVLNETGRKDLASDEVFVELLGSLLHQAAKTSKGALQDPD